MIEYLKSYTVFEENSCIHKVEWIWGSCYHCNSHEPKMIFHIYILTFGQRFEEKICLDCLKRSADEVQEFWKRKEKLEGQTKCRKS